jgi:NAD(P)-dependent dehydrogenase (short-subunit alcohol dehydrogenase family)
MNQKDSSADRKKQLVVITGTDSGIGLELANVFIKNGYTVLATYLVQSGVSGALTVPLDLRKEVSIVNVAERVNELAGTGFTLACLVNNAGIAFGGGIENLPVSMFRENFEVNFFGLISLTQKLIPLLIRSRGRIILHGSAAGKTAVPFLSPYASSKFALEGFSDCLRRELLPYGIATILLETGGVSTPIWDGFSRQDTSFMDEKYDKTIGRFEQVFLKGPKGLTAAQAAGKIFRVFGIARPKPRYIIAKSVFREHLIRLVPARTLDRLFVKMFDMDYGNNMSRG